MNFWPRLVPALALAFALAVFAEAVMLFVREDRIGGSSPSLGGGETTRPEVDVRPVATGSDPAGRAPRPVPAGLVELTMGPPERVRLETQRAELQAHLARIKLSLLVPDAMSYASKRQGSIHVLSAASSPGTGFFLFSEKGGKRLLAGGARKFLRDFFKDAFALPLIDADEKFLSRGLGEMTWIKGQSLTAQKFDAYAISAKKTGFSHLLFIYDPAVANASRRQMVDSMRIR